MRKVSDLPSMARYNAHSQARPVFMVNRPTFRTATDWRGLLVNSALASVALLAGAAIMLLVLS